MDLWEDRLHLQQRLARAERILLTKIEERELTIARLEKELKAEKLRADLAETALREVTTKPKGV